jgi:hypothetical protein
MALLLNETTWDLATPIRKATAAEQIRQSVGVRLKTRRGEWAFDTDQGLPFTEAIFTKDPDLALIESLIRSEVSLVTGVTGVTRVGIIFDADTRALTAEVDVATDEGLLTVTV